MAEAVALVGLASAIVQFVDFTGRIIARLNEFRSSRDQTPKTFLDLETLLQLLRETLRKIKALTEQGSLNPEAQRGVLEVVVMCNTHIKQLDDVLAKTLPTKGDSKLTRGIKAFSSMGREKLVRIVVEELRTSISVLNFHQTTLLNWELRQQSERGFHPQEMGVERGSAIPTPNGTTSFNKAPLQLNGLRNPNFTGRNATLQELHHIIALRQSKALTPNVLVIHGAGGVGKTQVVQEYAYRHQEDFTWIFVIEAHSFDALMTSYCNVAQQIVEHSKEVACELSDLLDTSSRNVSNRSLANRIVNAVKHWLAKKENRDWLLLLDNADDLENIGMSDFIPSSGTGTVIMTSRRPEYVRFGWALELVEMDEAEGLELLGRSARRDFGASSNEEIDEAKKITSALGYLPLAIDQAGAYIYKLKLSTKRYSSLLEANAAHVLHHKPPAAVWPYKSTVFATWETSLQTIERENPEAVEILTICAFLAGEDIWEEMLACGLPFAQITVLEEEALGTLCSFSLARRKDVGGCFSFHTLVQTWARTRRTKPDQQGFAEKALLVIAGAIKGLAAKTELDYGTSYRLLAHIDRCQKYLGSKPCNPQILHSTRAYLLLGRFCRRCGRFDQAMTWFERDLGEIANKSIVEQLETEDCIATTLLQKGDDVKAMEVFRRLYDSALNHLGKDHDLTVGVTNSLGILSKRMGCLQEAVCWYRSALMASTRKFGDADQRTLATMNNIAVVQKELSQFSDSLETLNTVLARKETALGENNSSTLETVMNIGIVYMHLKDYEKALHFLRRARDGKELKWGKSHPKYLDVVGNIANVYVKQGQLDEAIGFYKDLLHRYQTIFGDEHSRVHTTADWLGDVYRQQGNYEESLDWYRKALEGRRSMFGEENVLTLGTIVNIACVLDIQDLFVDAMLEYKKALDGFRNTLGPYDLRVQTVEHRLRTLLLRWAEYESR